MRRVVLIGSECTGKTTMAALLAKRYGTVWVPEAARFYAEKKQGPLTAADVAPIARMHLDAAGRALFRAVDLLFLDQDLVSTVVYSRHYYGDCPAWVERAAWERRADLYLLHRPDIPWFPDPSRDRGHQRTEMHDLFVAALRELGAETADIFGDGQARVDRAVGAVDTLLGHGR